MSLYTTYEYVMIYDKIDNIIADSILIILSTGHGWKLGGAWGASFPKI